MFLVCGEALYDVFSAPVEPDGSVPMHAVIGGSPLNVAVGLSRLGIATGLFAGISTDPLGEGLVRHLAREGVSAAHLRRKARPTTLSLVGLNEAGLPDYTFYGDNAADCSLTLADLPDLGPETTGLHVGSYTLVRAPVADTLATLVARERHRLITLDPNIRPTVEPDMAIWRVRIGALVPHVTVVKASEEDIALLHPGEDFEQVARRWLGLGPALVVVTRGEAGAMAFTANHALVLHAPAVEVVDTVGAGDTFQAAMIAGLLAAPAGDRAGVAALSTGQLEAILRRATAAAALTCRRRGADLPRAAELAAAGLA
jgi:fructokinase